MLANTEHVSVGRTERDGSGYGHKSVRINTTGDTTQGRAQSTRGSQPGSWPLQSNANGIRRSCLLRARAQELQQNRETVLLEENFLKAVIR